MVIPFIADSQGAEADPAARHFLCQFGTFCFITISTPIGQQNHMVDLFVAQIAADLIETGFKALEDFGSSTRSDLADLTFHFVAPIAAIGW